MSEMANRRVKRAKIREPRGKYLVYIEYFLLLSVQVQFGFIRCISDFRRPCTCYISEAANRRVKRTKIWTSGVSI